jgi:mRNA interferase RelE/StbE
VTYRVNFTSSATRQLKKIPRAVQPLIWQILADLAEEPCPSGVVKMASEAATYRVRVGDYRIVYEVQDEVLCILVIKVGHRREIYKDKR